MQLPDWQAPTPAEQMSVEKQKAPSASARSGGQMALAPVQTGVASQAFAAWRQMVPALANWQLGA